MAVRPSISCGNCGSPVGLNDSFCAKCGSSLVWDNAAVAEKSVSSGKIVCPSCGVSNAEGSELCVGCGTNLAAATAHAHARPSSKKKPTAPAQSPVKKNSSGKKLEPWQNFSIAGILVVVVLLGIGIFRNPPKEIPSQNQSMSVVPDAGVSPTLMNDIDALQKSVDANPKDTGTMLRLANALHDAKFMPRAIAMYQKYLALKPADPDARVDMAICFFESADSPTALKEMHTALKYDPKHQMATFNIGIVNLNQGNVQESNEWFKKTVALDPNTQVAQRAQQILTQHSTIKQ